MWLLFVLACALCTGLLFLPGFLVTFSVGRMRRYDVLACAPLVGVAFYAVIAIVLSGAGVRASIFSIALPLLLIGIVFALVRLVVAIFGRRRAPCSSVGVTSIEDSFRFSLFTGAL